MDQKAYRERTPGFLEESYSRWIFLILGELLKDQKFNTQERPFWKSENLESRGLEICIYWELFRLFLHTLMLENH